MKYYKSPFGWISYEIKDNYLISMGYTDSGIASEVDFVSKALDDYFSGKTKTFNIPYKILKGTDFQKKVWQALLDINYGETKTYKEIADIVGSKKAFRAVGGACKANPIGVVIPCHRVIGSNNKLTGYQGKSGILTKEKLINFEKGNK